MIIVRDATFTQGGKHRIHLSRIWDEPKGLAFYCGLNPSKAGKRHDDMTVKKGVGFAARWGLGGTLHGNAYSLVSTDPRELRAGELALDPENDATLLSMARRAKLVVLCWGSFKGFEKRFSEVARLLAPFSPKCVGRTKNGYPQHISRIAYATPLEAWSTND